MSKEAAATPFHVGLTPGQIVDAALDLTRARHLFGWSIRDLAGALNVAPSAIYHHVGGKDRIARHVSERVLGMLPTPAPDLGWQDWFRTLLESSYPVLTHYPGVAKWVMLHGPTFPAVITVLDAGVTALQRAGFAESASQVYVLLFSNAMLTIAIGDERLVHEDDGPRDHANLMAEFATTGGDSIGVQLLSEELMTGFAAGGQTAARQREEYYRLVVRTTIAGAEHLLLAAE